MEETKSFEYEPHLDKYIPDVPKIIGHVLRIVKAFPTIKKIEFGDVTVSFLEDDRTFGVKVLRDGKEITDLEEIIIVLMSVLPGFSVRDDSYQVRYLDLRDSGTLDDKNYNGRLMKPRRKVFTNILRNEVNYRKVCDANNFLDVTRSLRLDEFLEDINLHELRMCMSNGVVDNAGSMDDVRNHSSVRYTLKEFFFEENHVAEKDYADHFQSLLDSMGVEKFVETLLGKLDYMDDPSDKKSLVEFNPVSRLMYKTRILRLIAIAKHRRNDIDFVSKDVFERVTRVRN